MRATLRALPVLTGAAPAFDPHRAPDDPVALFVEWLTAAMEAGVPDPHAPDARMLILKDPQPLADAVDLDVALAKARAGLEADPALVPDEWVSYAVAPERVEFWQGDPERRHQRLLYTADLDAPGGWSRTRLWPWGPTRQTAVSARG